jgi:hypothetical protein
MVMEERRARTVSPRLIEPMRPDLCLMAGCCELGGASKDITSDVTSGLENGILAMKKKTGNLERRLEVG